MATTEIYTLSLHDALPILDGNDYSVERFSALGSGLAQLYQRDIGSHQSEFRAGQTRRPNPFHSATRSEEHTSELQSHSDLVCRLLLEKKKKKNKDTPIMRK